RHQAAHTGTDFFDPAGALMAADDGKGDGHVAGEQVLVGVAHARGGKLDENLALLGRVELNGLDAPRLAVPQNGCFGLHGPSPGSGVPATLMGAVPRTPLGAREDGSELLEQ